MEILKKIRRGLVKIVKPILSEGLRITYKCLYKFVKVDEKMVIFISFHGRGYSDNPRAIYQEMLKDENTIVNAIGFNLGHLSEEYTLGDKIDVAGVLEINNFGNQEIVQINIKDIMKSI